MSKGILKDQINQIKDDIIPKIRTLSLYATADACSYLEDAATSAMEEFYNQYTPRKYIRTYNLRDNTIHVDRPHVWRGSDFFKTSVIVSSEDMQEYDGEIDPPGKILNTMWIEGYRGSKTQNEKNNWYTPNINTGSEYGVGTSADRLMEDIVYRWGSKKALSTLDSLINMIF